MYWLKAKNKKIASFIVILGLIGSIGAMSTLKRSSEDTEASTQNRMIFWKAGINMAVRNPLFGVGYEGYIPNLLRYANGNVGTDGTKMTIHSTWLLALAETGFVGFFLYMAIITCPYPFVVILPSSFQRILLELTFRTISSHF